MMKNHFARFAKFDFGWLITTIMVLGLTVFAAIVSSERDERVHSGVLRLIERAKVANYDLNMNVLKLRTFMLDKYDALESDVTELQGICHSAKHEEEYALLRRADTAMYLERLCAAVERRVQMVADYRLKHAAMRNAIKSLPPLIDHVRLLRADGGAPMLLAQVVLYNFEPVTSLEKKIRSNLNELSTRSRDQKLVSEIKKQVDVVLDHARARQSLEEGLTGEVRDRLNQLELAYTSGWESRQATAQWLNYLLMAICFALGAWLIRTFLRLRHVGKRLTDLNSKLEEKVQSRTEALSIALKELNDQHQMLAQTTKMTALGEMAGGIAHEINTPLAAILMNAESLIEEFGAQADSRIKNRLHAIVRIVDRVSKIITGLRKFSRNADSAEKSEYEVGMVIEDTLTLCAEKLRSHSVDLEVDVPESACLIWCVPEQISQVLLNLLNNSLDALKDSVPVGERWIRIAAKARGSNIEIAVTDAGKGLPPEVQAKLMQPFFTTKPVGVGTGIGLSISKGIVENHGGRLSYDKECPHTRFVIEIPRSAASSALAA